MLRANNGEAALEVLDEETPGAGMDGDTVCQLIHEFLQLPFIMVASSGQIG